MPTGGCSNVRSQRRQLIVPAAAGVAGTSAETGFPTLVVSTIAFSLRSPALHSGIQNFDFDYSPGRPFSNILRVPAYTRYPAADGGTRGRIYRPAAVIEGVTTFPRGGGGSNPFQVRHTGAPRLPAPPLQWRCSRRQTKGASR